MATATIQTRPLTAATFRSVNRLTPPAAPAQVAREQASFRERFLAVLIRALGAVTV